MVWEWYAVAFQLGCICEAKYWWIHGRCAFLVNRDVMILDCMFRFWNVEFIWTWEVGAENA